MHAFLKLGLKSASLWVALHLCGCAVSEMQNPLPETFLEGVDTSKKLENLPFEHAWIWTELDEATYTEIYVKPVRSDTLPQADWVGSRSPAIQSYADYTKAAEELAQYFHAELISEMKKIPNPSFRIVDSVGPNVLAVDIALTELTLSHPVLNAATLLAPVPGASQALSTMSSPHVAFAAKFTAGSDNILIATAADRKFPPTRFIDLNKLSATSPVREICSAWAKMLAEAIQRGKDSNVENRGTFSILPW